MQLSVVIITKNEAHNICDCILSARKISTDIIVLDSASNDNTVSLANQMGAHTYSHFWRGYGHARNTGAALAKNNWILSLDADERCTNELLATIQTLPFSNPAIVYGFRRLNFYCGSLIRFGEPGKDFIYRIYNKLHASWTEVPVHEKIQSSSLQKEIINGSVLHYGIRSIQQDIQKKRRYAYLAALKYKAMNKNNAWLLRYISPAFHFIKTYFFQLGFMDGKKGFVIAKINTQYTWEKYNHLHQLWCNQKKTAGEMNFANTSLKKTA